MNTFRLTTRVFFFTMTFAVLGSFAVKAQNNAWRCVKDNDSVKVFSRKSDSANYRIIKATTELKTSLSSLVALLTDANNQKNWVFMNKKAEVIKKESPFSWILYSQTDAPWPVTDRDVITKARMTQDSLTQTVTINGEAIPKYKPKDPDHVRIPYALSQWRFIPKNNGWIKVVFTLELDVGGSVPKWIANLTAAKGPYQILRKLREEVRRKKYRNVHLAYIKEPEIWQAWKK